MNNCRSDFNWQYIVESINKTTSPGFPYTRELHGHPAFTTKADLFKYKNGDYARDVFQQYLSHMRSYPSLHVEFFTLSAKPELLKIHKIEQDMFRTFTASSWVETAAGIALLGPTIQQFYSNYANTWSYVGGSMYDGCWNELFRRLSKHPNAFECDETSFDATIHPDFIYMLRDIFWEFIADKTQENRALLYNLFDSIVTSHIICPNGDIFVKCQGNPSGSFLTVVLNTMILYAMMAYAWIVLVPEGFANYDAFHDHVEAALYGDDNLWTISDQMVQYFNPTNVAQVWADLGIIISKEKCAEGKLIDLHFLSHGFHDAGGLIVPMGNVNRSMCSMYYDSNGWRGPKWSYIKAAALLQNIFWDLPARVVFRGFLEYLERTQGVALRMEPSGLNDDTLRWRDIQKMQLTDRDIASHFFPFETRYINQSLGECCKAGLCVMPKNAAARKRQRQRRAAKNRAGGLSAKTPARLRRNPARGGRGRGRGGRGRPNFGGNRSAMGQGAMGSVGSRSNGVRLRRGGPGLALSRMVAAPTAFGRSFRQGGPRMMGGNDFRVQHTEYLFDVDTDGDGDLDTQFLALNPGLPGTFMWLSNIAANFTYYRINSMVFHYEPVASTGVAGNLGMLIDYNPRNNAQTSFSEYAQFLGSVTGTLWTEDNMRFIRPAEAKARYFIRVGAQPSGTDIREYDVGSFQLAVFGASALNTTVGRLLVSYDVTLMVPRNPSASSSSSIATSTLDDGKTFPYSAANPFNNLGLVGSASVAVAKSGNFLNPPGYNLAAFREASYPFYYNTGSNTASTIIMPPGFWIIYCQWTGNSASTAHWHLNNPPFTYSTFEEDASLTTTYYSYASDTSIMGTDIGLMATQIFRTSSWVYLNISTSSPGDLKYAACRVYIANLDSSIGQAVSVIGLKKRGIRPPPDNPFDRIGDSPILLSLDTKSKSVERKVEKRK